MKEVGNRGGRQALDERIILLDEMGLRSNLLRFLVYAVSVLGNREARPGSRAWASSHPARAGGLRQPGDRSRRPRWRGRRRCGGSARAAVADLPEEWRLVREREGESYRWPSGRDQYAPLPRVHGSDACRRSRSDRARGDGSREQVGTRPEVRRRLPQRRLPPAAAGGVRRGGRLRAEPRARRGDPRQRRRAPHVRRRRCPPPALHGALPNPDLQRARSSTPAPGTRSSWSPARTTTRPSSTTH